ncbi:uncharacterized protein [Nicotiana tomentosiformis]|uniref:uncharacterized protein n=1 Tax=Nicotiana tomentosiformis TaxID=4098 RepID=UPI00388CD717
MPEDEQRRLDRFGRLRPPSFSGAEEEDAQGFLDRCQRILRTTGILETSEVSFTTFQFSGASFSWWDAYERCRPVCAAPLTWQQFSFLILEKFVPQSHREELRRQFEQLRQGDMSVTQYEMRYSELARHAIWGHPFRHAQTTRPVHRGASSGHGAHSYWQGQSSISVLPTQNLSHAPSAQGSSVSGPSSSYSGTQGSLQSPQPFVERGCFKCGDLGHIKRHYLRLSGGSYQQRSRPSTSAPVTSPPAQPDRGGA